MKSPSTDTTNAVRVQPGDVLMGRTSHIYNHPGNIRYRKMINSHHEAYHALKSRLDKMIFIRQLTYKILDDGRVRFVKFNKKTGKWIAIDSKDIQDKVSHALRDTKSNEGEDQKMYASLFPDCKESAEPPKDLSNSPELQEMKQPKQQEIRNPRYGMADQNLSLETGSMPKVQYEALNQRQLQEYHTLRGVDQNASINVPVGSASKANLQLQGMLHYQQLNNARLMERTALQQWQGHMRVASLVSELANKNNILGGSTPLGPLLNQLQDLRGVMSPDEQQSAFISPYMKN